MHTFRLNNNACFTLIINACLTLILMYINVRFDHTSNPHAFHSINHVHLIVIYTHQSEFL